MALSNILNFISFLGQVWGVPYPYSGNKTATVISISYSIIFGIFQLVVLINSSLKENNPIIYFQIEKPSNRKGRVQENLQIVQIYLCYLDGIFSSLLAVIKLKRLKNFGILIKYFKQTLKSMGCKNNSQKFIIEFYVTCTIWVVTALSIILVNYSITKNRNTYIVIYRSFSLFIEMIIFMQFSGNILICTDASKNLNNLMKQRKPKIKMLLKLYDILTEDISNHINQIYGLQLLIFIMQSFGVIIGEIYHHFITKASFNSIDRFCGIMWLIVTFLAIGRIVLIVNRFKSKLDCFGSLFHEWELREKCLAGFLHRKIVSIKL